MSRSLPLRSLVRRVIAYFSQPRVSDIRERMWALTDELRVIEDRNFERRQAIMLTIQQLTSQSYELYVEQEGAARLRDDIEEIV